MDFAGDVRARTGPSGNLRNGIDVAQQEGGVEGKTVSHYRILQKIGEGGMGDVYLAEDTSLERKVALKFLPENLQQDEVARMRFIREAKSAAALDHPYICKIYETGEVGGQSFIAMEYVRGQTIKEMLSEGRLPLKQVLQIGSEVAEALERAHDEGIVHRDLKPANIMLPKEGHAKVMDFGLAKRLTTAGDEGGETTEGLTWEGTTLGTLNYMSPEQLRGQPIDTRSDIFSFGVVLYEMVTGIHPFRRESANDTISAALNEDPAPLSRYLNDTPEALQHILRKMLAKDRRRRSQSMREVQNDLEQLVDDSGRAPLAASQKVPRWLWLVPIPALLLVVLLGIYWSDFSQSESGGTADPQLAQTVQDRKSIAVLPLENLTGEAEQDYFVDGMTEALTAELSKLGAFKVIARTSAMRYRQTDKSAREIARELGVDVLVEGSVLRAKNEVRITAQLIDGNTEEHLWAQSFDRELTSILALHSDVAQAIAREIQIAVTPAEETDWASARPVNPEAYELYLKGRYHHNKWTAEEFEKATEYFRKAIEVDPNYAPAYAGLVECYQWFAWFGSLPSREAYAKFDAPLRKALEIGDTLPEVNLRRADTSFYFDRDWGRAEREYKRAIELNPSFAKAHSSYAWYLMAMGRFPEAIVAAEIGLQLDPFSTAAKLTLGEVYYNAHQYEQAVTEYRQSIELEPNGPAAYEWLASAYEQKGMYEDVVRARQKAMTLSGARPEEVAALAHAYSVSGSKGYLMWRLERLKDQYAPYNIAEIYARLGNREQAFAWLEKAYRQQHTQMVLLKVSPSLDPLRDDPRFQDLLRRMNFPIHD